MYTHVNGQTNTHAHIHTDRQILVLNQSYYFSLVPLFLIFRLHFWRSPYSGTVGWNRTKVAKEARQRSSLLDSRELQSLNDQSKTLFGVPYETNFSAPMPLPTNKEESRAPRR